MTTTVTTTKATTVKIIMDEVTSTLGPVAVVDGASSSSLQHYAPHIAAASAVILLLGLCIALRHFAKNGREARKAKGMRGNPAMDDMESQEDQSPVGSPSRHPLVSSVDSPSPQMNAGSIFDSIDRNHDGVISREEFGQVFHNAHPPTPGYPHAAPPTAYTLPPMPQTAAMQARVVMPMGAQTATFGVPTATRAYVTTQGFRR